MADLDKVIREIKLCTGGGPCEGCSHYGHGEDLVGCMDELLSDALELLKEQEAVEPDTDSEGTCTCGNCGETVGYYPVGCKTPQQLCKFCPECGRSVKWNEVKRHC